MENKQAHIKSLLQKSEWTSYDAGWWDHYLAQPDQDDLRSVARELFNADIQQLTSALDQKHSEQLLLNIHQRIQAIHPQNRKTKIIRWLPYAAAICIVGLIGGWLFFGDQLWQQDQIAEQPIVYYAEDIAPGGHRAVLTLANGQSVQLRSDQGRLIISDNIHYADGELVLQEWQKQNPSQTHPATAFNTIATPKGGQYQVVLPDGTKVWLNAASILRYPSQFDSRERIVELEGEGYFEVTSGQQKPQAFIVRTNSQTIRVLGTQFNVSAYADEPDTKTTLVEGRVQIDVPNSKNLTLAPGEQAIVQNGTVNKYTVDVQNFIGWKNGVIILDKTDLHRVIRQIERWYDVDFEFGNTDLPQNKKLNGVLHRDTPLSGILEVLALNTGKTFEIIERRVIIR